MLCCHLLHLTANKAWGFELSRQPKVLLCDVRAGWCLTERCRVELCQGSSSVQTDFLPPRLLKMSGCVKEQRLCSLLLRTMRNLLGRSCSCFECVWLFGMGCEIRNKAAGGVELALNWGPKECWHGAWCLDKVHEGPGNLKNTRTLFWI